MALKESISKIAKSVEEGAKSAAKKSGDLVGVTKLNRQITIEEEGIKDIYTSIGELVYSKKFKTNENIENELMGLCSEIEEKEESINSLKQKIAELRNKKICPSCGNEMEFNINFCPNCGAKQETIEVKQEFVEREPEHRCPNCGIELGENDAFCPNCGSRIEIQ